MMLNHAIFRTLSLTLLCFPAITAGYAQQWERVEALPANEFTALFSSGNVLIAAGVNRVHFSYDGGETWSDSNPVFAAPGFITSLQYANGRLYVGDIDHGVASTSDNGQHWQSENTGLNGLGAFNITSLAVREDFLYAGTSGSGVFVKNLIANSPWVSYNAGMPWSNIFSLNELDGKLYAGAGGSSTFAVQAPPGNAWIEKPFSNFSGELDAFLDITRQDNIVLGAGSSGLFRSTDGGESWTYYNPGTGFLEYARLVVAGNQVIASLTKTSGQSFLQATEDQGLSWHNFDPEFPPGSIAYDLILCNNQLFSARSNGLWRLVLPTNTQERGAPNAFLGQNFPNPASVATTIPVTLLNSDHVSLMVIDATGLIVRQLYHGKQAAGSYEISFDVTNLAAGFYTYRLVTASGTVARRMVIGR
ncbi:MAG: T9SS type A sorting domain-containing protein [Saprospiraceae bacterium]|nr:T9SS type A sorting domain-containing protein [Saprospiraceae bacterium]